jgi:DNA-binding MarR family transcriptional regulator
MSTASQRVFGAVESQPPSDRPEVAIPYLLKSLHHSLRHAVDDALRQEKLDLSFAHLATLYGLECESGLTGAELARRGFVTAQTMNSLLRRLELDRDIVRRPHPANQRADTWYLTKVGQNRLTRAKRVGETVWARLLSALAPREVAQFQGLLQRCIEGIDLPPVAPQRAAPRRRTATLVRSSRR